VEYSFLFVNGFDWVVDCVILFFLFHLLLDWWAGNGLLVAFYCVGFYLCFWGSATVVYYDGVLLGVCECLWGVVLLIWFCVGFDIDFWLQNIVFLSLPHWVVHWWFDWLLHCCVGLYFVFWGNMAVFYYEGVLSGGAEGAVVSSLADFILCCFWFRFW
jgi:hypothetical protein